MKIVQCCVCRYNCTIKVSKYCTLYKVRNKAILGLKDGVKSANSLPSLPFSLSVCLFNLSEEAAAFLIVHLVTFLLQVSSPPYDDSYGKISITARNCCHLPALFGNFFFIYFREWPAEMLC